MPREIQARVVAEVALAKERSGMPVREWLQQLGISVTTYYRWVLEEAWQCEASRPVLPVQVFEALPEEKAAVKRNA